MNAAVRMACAAGLVATGCAADPVEIARLRYEGGDPQIVVPASGAIDQQLDVVVGSEAGSCDEQVSTEVEHTNDGVIITPYIREETSECDSALRFLEYRAVVSFAEAGEHRVVIRGRVGSNILELPYTVTIE